MVFLPLIYSNLTVSCYSVSSYSFSYYCRFLRLFVVIVLRSVETNGLALHLRCQFVTIQPCFNCWQYGHESTQSKRQVLCKLSAVYLLFPAFLLSTRDYMHVFLFTVKFSPLNFLPVITSPQLYNKKSRYSINRRLFFSASVHMDYLERR